MSTPWYNDPLAIEQRVTGLKEIADLIRERHEAGERQERLTQLVLRGALDLDERGHLDVFESALLPPALRKLVPVVCTHDAFIALVEEQGKPPQDGGWWRGWSHYGSFMLPSIVRRCARCGKGWSIENFWDVFVNMDTPELPLGEYVGKTLAQVRPIIADRPDGVFHIAFQDGKKMTIRPAGVPSVDELGDLSPEEFDAWSARLRDVDETYVVEAGDILTVFGHHFYHGDCYDALTGERIQQEKDVWVEDMRQVIEEAGFTGVAITSAPLPSHIAELWKAEVAEMPEECNRTDPPYFQVVTDQGCFGLTTAAEGIPCFDLPPGTTRQDFGFPASQGQPEFPLCPIDLEDLYQLRQLRELLPAQA